MTESKTPMETSWRTSSLILPFVVALAFNLTLYPLADASADQDSSELTAGENSYSNGQEIQVSYTAIDKVRYPSKFGGYPLPSPDDPLRLTVQVDSIPPSQADIDRYYHNFDGYELLGTDYSFGCLRYVYFWPQGGTSREEAEKAFEEEVASHATEEEFEEERDFYAKIRELRAAGDLETAEKLEDERAGIEPESTDETATQEEMIEMSLHDIQQNLKDARKRGNDEEVEQLEHELAQVQSELSEERATTTDVKEIIGNDAESNRPTATIIAAIALIAAAATIAIAIHAKRKDGAA